jgi:hypothetical protein
LNIKVLQLWISSGLQQLKEYVVVAFLARCTPVSPVEASFHSENKKLGRKPHGIEFSWFFYRKMSNVDS